VLDKTIDYRRDVMGERADGATCGYVSVQPLDIRTSEAPATTPRDAVPADMLLKRVVSQNPLKTAAFLWVNVYRVAPKRAKRFKSIEHGNHSMGEKVSTCFTPVMKA